MTGLEASGRCQPCNRESLTARGYRPGLHGFTQKPTPRRQKHPTEAVFFAQNAPGANDVQPASLVQLLQLVVGVAPPHRVAPDIVV